MVVEQGGIVFFGDEPPNKLDNSKTSAQNTYGHHSMVHAGCSYKGTYINICKNYD